MKRTSSKGCLCVWSDKEGIVQVNRIEEQNPEDHARALVNNEYSNCSLISIKNHSEKQTHQQRKMC